MDHRVGAGHHVACGKDARDRGLAAVVHHQQAEVVALQAFGRGYELVLGLLRCGDDDRVGGALVQPVLVARHLARLVKDSSAEEGPLVVHLHDGLAVLDDGAVKLGQLHLVRAGRHVARPGEEGHAAGAVAEGRAGHVHGGVAHADDRDRLADIAGIGADQVVQAKVDVAAGLALDAQGLGAPGARADEDGLVAVAEEVVDSKGPADGRVGADADALALQHAAVAVDDGLGQAEVGDAVAEDPAHVGPLLEDGDVAAGGGQAHGHDDARGA